MENKKNLPVPYKITQEQEFNLVSYVDNAGNIGVLYCDSVRVIAGWAILENVRVKDTFHATIEKVSPIFLVKGSIPIEKRIFHNQAKSVSQEGYYTLATKTLHEKKIRSIDSYVSNGGGGEKQLPLWTQIPEIKAIQMANEALEKQNRETRISNRIKFSYLIYQDIWDKLYAELGLSGAYFFRKLFRLSDTDWIDKRWQDPDIIKMKEELIAELKEAFKDPERPIKYEGELEYNEAIGRTLYNDHGSCCKYNVDIEMFEKE